MWNWNSWIINSKMIFPAIINMEGRQEEVLHESFRVPNLILIYKWKYFCIVYNFLNPILLIFILLCNQLWFSSFLSYLLWKFNSIFPHNFSGIFPNLLLNENRVENSIVFTLFGELWWCRGGYDSKLMIDVMFYKRRENLVDFWSMWFRSVQRRMCS